MRVCVCVDFQVVCRGSCCSGTDGSGRGVFEGEPVEDQTGRVQEGKENQQHIPVNVTTLKTFLRNGKLQPFLFKPYINYQQAITS